MKIEEKIQGYNKQGSNWRVNNIMNFEAFFKNLIPLKVRLIFLSQKK